MLCDVICEHSYFVTSSMVIQSRSNCDAATGNILRQHYQRPYFLPRSAESSKTDWIFMGSPGYGAHMHVSGHVLFFFFFLFVFWSRTILQASATSFPRFPASCYVTLQTSVSGILSCHSPSLNFRYLSLSRPKPEVSGFVRWMPETEAWSAGPYYCIRVLISLSLALPHSLPPPPPPLFYFIIYIPYVFSFSPWNNRHGRLGIKKARSFLLFLSVREMCCL